jgi:hypothetical protein
MEVSGQLQVPAALSTVDIGYKAEWFQSRSERYRGKKNFLPCLESNPRRLARSLVAIQTKLSIYSVKNTAISTTMKCRHFIILNVEKQISLTIEFFKLI